MAVALLQSDPVDPPAVRVWVVVYAEMKPMEGISELEDETELEAKAAAASDPSTQAAPHTAEPKSGRTCRSGSILSSSASTVAQVSRSICHKALELSRLPMCWIWPLGGKDKKEAERAAVRLRIFLLACALPLLPPVIK